VSRSAPSKKTRSKKAKTSGLKATADECRAWYRQLCLLRRFEEQAAEAYSLGKIGGFCHLYIGQEAVAVGSMAALREDDYVLSSYREHGLALARGMSAKSIMAELFGKAAGCSGGKGGSMHLFDASVNFLGGHGIVGGQIPLGTGMAFAAKYRRSNQVSVTFFGEAAANIGSFHESLNMASLWKLPAVYVIENNGYGMGTAIARATANMDLFHRAYSYDMEAEAVDGQDLFAVREAMDRAVQRARSTSEPSLLEMRTYRYVGHSMSDAAHGTYRTKEEVETYRQRDPINVLADTMKQHDLIDDDGLKAIDDEVKAEVADAVSFAEQAPDPEPDALYTDVYAEEGRC
jgi:pyruvate dehydrogenase E1 component alpha subunit